MPKKEKVFTHRLLNSYSAYSFTYEQMHLTPFGYAPVPWERRLKKAMFMYEAAGAKADKLLGVLHDTINLGVPVEIKIKDMSTKSVPVVMHCHCVESLETTYTGGDYLRAELTVRPKSFIAKTKKKRSRSK